MIHKMQNQQAVITAIANAQTKTAAVRILRENGISVPKEIVNQGTLNDVIEHFVSVLETGRDKTKAQFDAIAVYRRNANSKDDEAFKDSVFLEFKELISESVAGVIDQFPFYTTHDSSGNKKFVTLKYPVVPALPLSLTKINNALTKVLEAYPNRKCKVDKTKNGLGVLVRIYA